MASVWRPTATAREPPRRLTSRPGAGGDGAPPPAHPSIATITADRSYARLLVRTWLQRAREAGIKRAAVGSLDDDLLMRLSAEGVPAFKLDTGADVGGEIGFGGASFKAMGRAKARLACEVLRRGQSLLLTDADALVLRDPTAYLHSIPNADLLYSSEGERSAVRDLGLEPPQGRPPEANIGVLFFKPSALPFAEAWLAALERDQDLWDQRAFNNLITDGAQLEPSPSRLVRVLNGTVRAGALSINLFCGGPSYFFYDKPRTLGYECYTVHSFAVPFGPLGKINALRAHGLVSDPPEHFRDPVGFVSYSPELPTPMLEAAKAAGEGGFNGSMATAAPHIDLVNYQLSQLRSLFVLADLLWQRAPVLPRFWCGLGMYHQNAWQPGFTPSNLTSPFQCPTSYILDISRLQSAYPQWRQGGFLEDPQAAPLLRNSLRVGVCASVDDPRCVPRRGPVGGTLWIPPRQTPTQVLHDIAPYNNKYPLIHVKEGILRMFRLDNETIDAYRWKLDLHSSWCCDRGGASARYDMWSDAR